MKDKKLLKLIQRFNTAKVHLVISRWPGKGKKATFDGIATYTEDTLLSFVKEFGARFVVLAEQVEGEPDYEVVEKNVLVLRVFNPKHHSLFPDILRWLPRFGRIKTVYVHSEFCASGGPQMKLMILPFLALIRMTGRSITYYMHNVVDDLSGIGQHLNLEPSSLKLKVFTEGLKGYYRVLGLLVNRFVVLEEIIKERLQKYVGSREITVQPHWVKTKNSSLSAREAKERLGLDPDKITVLSFGFVTYYKGADWLARFAEYALGKRALRQFQFVLAGGPAYSLQDEKYYQKYYANLEKKSARLTNLTLTGFIPDEQIALWMKAADVVVFPYRGLIGGSGALQQALKHSKLFWQSKPMIKEMMNSSIRLSLQKAELAENEVAFALSTQAFEKLLKRYGMSANYRRDLQRYCKNMQQIHSYEQLVGRHYREVFKDEARDKNSLRGLTGQALAWLKAEVID